MWRIEYIQNSIEQKTQIGDSYIDLETELLQLSDEGIDTNTIKVFYRG